MSIMIKQNKVLASLFFAVGFLFSGPGAAHWVVVHDWGRGWHSVRWHDNWRPCCGYSGPVYRKACVFVGGHWENGFWVPGHRVCR